MRLRHSHRETMGLEGGVYLYHKMTPPPNLGHSWVIFDGWSQILPSTKLFRHGFEQSCSAMAAQKLEEKVQQHDEVVKSSKSGCRRQWRLLQPVVKHTSKCHVQVPCASAMCKCHVLCHWLQLLQPRFAPAAVCFANRGHMAKHTSKCLHSSATPVPGASCAKLPFGRVNLLSMSKITPLNVWGSNLKFLT